MEIPDAIWLLFIIAAMIITGFGFAVIIKRRRK